MIPITSGNMFAICSFVSQRRLMMKEGTVLNFSFSMAPVAGTGAIFQFRT